MERTIGTTLVRLVRGDLTLQEVDAVVNAANSSLLGGGGVDGAIHRAGGPAILEECKEVVARCGRLPPGQAVITGGGRLPARWVIHTVGPIWGGGKHGEEEVLRSAYRESLLLAEASGGKTVAFPSISTGAYGYPVAEAARAALSEVAGRLREGSALAEVRFVLHSAGDLDVYRGALEELGSWT